MSDKSTLNREALLKVTSLIRPALATQTFIPAYNHIAFDGDFALTHNDIAAIQVRCDFPEPCCVPGELLIKALGSFSAESVLLQRAGNDQTLLISSGRSKLKVPTMPLKSFPFEIPLGSDGALIHLSKEVVAAIDKCLVSVGNNPNHPATMGVTLDVDGEGCAVLFATDNYTISRHATNTEIKLPGDSPVILPTFFCNQLIALAKIYSDHIKLCLIPGAIMAEFGGSDPVAVLFTKTIADLEPLDFPKIIKRHVDLNRISKDLAKIPDMFDACFARQLLVLGAELDKVTQVKYDDGTVKLRSTSQVGESDESFSFSAGPDKDLSFCVDPALVVRGSKLCSRMALGEHVLVMADDKDFLHIIAHVSAPAKA